MSATTMSQTTTRRPLLLVAAIIVALGTGLYVSGGWRTAQVMRETVSQPLGSAKSADITIAMGVGRLRIDALDQPGQGQVQARVEGGVGTITIQQIGE
jgi:hypothetical protein